jgi:hypothetical protein
MRIELHLGVHKTATTHLQRFWTSCARLPAARAACPALEEVRARLTSVVGAPAKDPAEDEARRASAVVWLSQWHGTRPAVVLSDENLIGTCERVFSLNAIYGGALPRLQRLAELLHGHEVRVWLSVREYGAFLRSAYCEMLRHGAYRPFRQAYVGMDVGQRGWEHLAQDILQAFPGAELRCWRYESLQAVRGPITEALLGLPVARQPAADEQRDRRSFSRIAVRLLDDLFQRVGPDDATRARPSVERIVAGPGMAPFDPWDDAERRDFSAAYERSLAALQAMPSVTWLG